MPSPTTYASEVLRIARKAPLRAATLTKAGIPTVVLSRLVEAGRLERAGRGLYRLPKAPVTELHSLALVATLVPRATVCLLSALQAHGLTTEAPHEVWVMIDSRARKPKLAHPPLHIIRASGEARIHGVAVRSVEGVRVAITTPAKTVADCFRYRSHVGLDVAIEALRDYLRKHPRGVSAVVDAAKADRVFSVMRPYLEALT